MRKVMLTILGIIAGITAISLIGPLAGLAVSAAITYAGVHYYLKANSTLGKVLSAGVAIIAGLTAITNIPGFIAIIALAGAYVVYRKWDNKDEKVFTSTKSNDPFTNFEKQWSEIKK